MLIKRFFFSILFISSLSHAFKVDKKTCSQEQAIMIEAWMNEAIYLFDRGGKVLQEVTSLSAAGELPPQYRSITDMILGPRTPKFDEEDWEEMAKTMLDISAKAATADIKIECDYLGGRKKGWWDVQGPQTEENSRTAWTYPISLARLGITDKTMSSALKESIRTTTWIFPDAKTIQFPMTDNDREAADNALGLTFSGFSSFASFLDKFLIVGPGDKPSSSHWTDIVFGPPTWEKVKTEKNWLEYVSDWFDLDKLFKLEKPLLLSASSPRIPGSLCTMHELMHSHLGRILGHQEVDDPDKPKAKMPANGGVAVAIVASTPALNPKRNPDTYAFLATCLSMPWIRFWDDGVWDGRPRWNSMPGRPKRTDGKKPKTEEKVDMILIPKAIAKVGKDGYIDLLKISAKDKMELKKGPYAWSSPTDPDLDEWEMVDV